MISFIDFCFVVRDMIFFGGQTAPEKKARSDWDSTKIHWVHMKRRIGGTLLEKHGFADGDLYESAHDKIQMWVMDNKKRITLLMEHPELRGEHVGLYGTVTPNPHGYNLARPHLENELRLRKVSCNVEVPLVPPGHGKDDRIVGFIDCVLRDATTNTTSWKGLDRLYAIEVKSHVESFGSIMRELQFYKFYGTKPGPYNSVGLVCPPIPYADRIREQGYPVIEYIDATAE